ncbi:MAG: thymidylate synthase [Clostridiales bacterium]|jgi:thymidylate synthase|nr:thymidylate synthase [Eubacteriales bacterium]MDH7565526.1 thymidylate synthase [Clostridiales bacterium]
MKEIFVQGATLPEAYHKALAELYYCGEITECPDYNQKQKECSMTVFVENPLSEPMVSKLFIGGYEELEQYRQEVLDGILDFMIGHGWAYTYHSRIAEQISFIYDELKRNPFSRRAVIDIRDWKADTKEGNDSPACLQHMQFFVRENKLHLKVLMRSNDAPKAAFMNMFAFIMLQKRIADHLKYEMGTYTHRANSFHCYERDFKLLEGYMKGINSNADITYEYEGFFKPLMEESVPNIQKKVEQVRSNLKNNT